MKHKYHILEWKALDIESFLGLNGLHLAVFNFDRSAAGHFRLLVAAFDEKGDFIGTSTIEKHPSHSEPDLDNAYSLGLFFVSADDVKKYSGSGTKTLYFEPKSYTPTGATQKYVQYVIHDTAPQDDAFDTKSVVGTINPTPPRNSY
ncbi:MAG: hypothetical protein M3139_02860 [Bacteroidota bacterium]|nr:hypothetical protein [Bacteroidota bacterium]